jgi:hypothetical protein
MQLSKYREQPVPEGSAVVIVAGFFRLGLGWR